MSKEEKYAFEVYELIVKLFDKEDENYQFELTEIDLTAFFTGMLIANNMFFLKVTGNDGDLFDFISTQMRLAHQYATKPAEEEEIIGGE
ncbi:hypothetical protein [Oceanobacillus neutriphilus]|uniref:Uncharacterized protein n=1 Tax=Oceanobacillus neutriphilus TaxID=531815 RepID=A0ABQ2NPF3_9BACI|nr:hypothetical protein [Oceanobacillus neutriphilus]GGP07346.1 hypothetical protein GCM10011346_02970 [Oceanobacillus neutriphilus]